MDVLRRLRARTSTGLAVVMAALLAACTELRPSDDRRVDASDRSDATTQPVQPVQSDVDGGWDTGPADAGPADGGALDAGASDSGLCGGPCPCVPVVTSCDRSLVAHGARLVIRGTCLEPVDAVTLGGVSQRFVSRATDAGQLVIDVVDETTPVGVARPLVVSSPSGASDPFPVTVAHLVLSELDAISGGDHDDREFIELATGLEVRVDLAGYALLLVDGATDATYAQPPAFALGQTNANGRYVIGNAGVAGVVQRFARGSLGQGKRAHAAVLVQLVPSGSPDSSDMPTPLPAASTAIAAIDARILDAIVYGPPDADHDVTLLGWSFPLAAAREEVHEASGGDPAMYALRRCGDARRDGRVFGPARPTPNAPNGCP